MRFLDTFLTRGIYHMNRCGYIPWRLENYDNKSAVFLDNLAIEHIIPQNPHLSADWVSALGSNWIDIQREYLHTIGNLALMAYYAETSDAPFDGKLTMEGGFQESALN